MSDSLMFFIRPYKSTQGLKSLLKIGGICLGVVVLLYLLSFLFSPPPRLQFKEKTIVPRPSNHSELVDVVFSIYWRPGGDHLKEEELLDLAYYVIVGVNPNHTDIHHHFYFVYDASSSTLEESRKQVAALLRQEPFYSRLHNKPNVFIRVLPNDGRDFCNFYRAIIAKDHRPQAYTLFINTSVRGPIVNVAIMNALDGRWTEMFLTMFRKAQDMRAVALMWDCVDGIHYYSFAFMLDPQGVELARDHWAESCHIRDLNSNVWVYEIGFSHVILRAGGRFGVLSDVDYLQDLQSCSTNRPYWPFHFSQFKDTLYPADQIFFKAAGTSAFMNKRPAHVLKRLQMHSVFNTEYALRQFPLEGQVELFNLSFPDPVDWNTNNFVH